MDAGAESDCWDCGEAFRLAAKEGNIGVGTRPRANCSLACCAVGRRLWGCSMAGFAGRAKVDVSLNGEGGLLEPTMLMASRESCMSMSGTASGRSGRERTDTGDSDRVLEALSLSSGLSGGGSGGEEPKRKGKGEVREREMEGRRR